MKIVFPIVIYSGKSICCGGIIGEKLTNVQKELVIGSILGDGHLRPHRGGFVFEFSQSSKRKSYVEWKHRLLGNFATPKIYHQTGTREYYKLVTKTHSELKVLHGIFYENGRKRVPDGIGKILTPFAVAVWFMDDGSKSKDAFYFNTQGFDVEDQFKLVKALKKFHITSNLNKDGKYWRLRVLKKSNKKFLELVKPHMPEEFSHKLPDLK